MAQLPLFIKYPLDLSATNPTNLINGEVRKLGNRNRAFVPYGGPFYTHSLVLTDIDNQRVLEREVDYLALQPYEQAIEQSGLEVASVIYIKNPLVSDNIEINSYRVVGGEYSYAFFALEELIKNLDIDERPVKWLDLIGVPNAFPPLPHPHDIGDTYGWEYVALQLEGIIAAITNGFFNVEINDTIESKLEFILNWINTHPTSDHHNNLYYTKIESNLRFLLRSEAINFVKKSGDLMEGFLFLHHDPIEDMHAVNKRWVEKRTYPLVFKGFILYAVNNNTNGSVSKLSIRRPYGVYTDSDPSGNILHHLPYVQISDTTDFANIIEEGIGYKDPTYVFNYDLKTNLPEGDYYARAKWKVYRGDTLTNDTYLGEGEYGEIFPFKTASNYVKTPSVISISWGIYGIYKYIKNSNY